MDRFVTLIMVMESWVYAHIQTHKNVHIKCVKLFYIKHKSTEFEKVRNLLLVSKLQYLFFTVTTQVETSLSGPQILPPQLDKPFYHLNSSACCALGLLL